MINSKVYINSQGKVFLRNSLIVYYSSEKSSCHYGPQIIIFHYTKCAYWRLHKIFIREGVFRGQVTSRRWQGPPPFPSGRPQSLVGCMSEVWKPARLFLVSAIAPGLDCPTISLKQTRTVSSVWRSWSFKIWRVWSHYTVMPYCLLTSVVCLGTQREEVVLY